MPPMLLVSGFGKSNAIMNGMQSLYNMFLLVTAVGKNKSKRTTTNTL